MKLLKINKISKNPIISNLIVAAICSFSSIIFVKSCEKRKLSNTYFDFDPAKSGTNFVSLFPGEGKDVGGKLNEIYADFSLSDTIYVEMFVDYRNGGTEIIEKPIVKVETFETSGTTDKFIFYAELNSDNAPKIIDNAILKKLPNEWVIELVSGHNENTHHITNSDICDDRFNYEFIFEKKDIKKILTKGYQLRDRLEIVGNGWCSQGTIAIKYRIIKIK